MRRGIGRMGVMGLALLASACIVTDRIEFSDKINMPPQLVDADPVTDVLHMADDDSPRTFIVQVWDPDVRDADSYEGMISLIEESNLVPLKKLSDGSCVSKVEAPDSSEYKGGILVEFECTVNFSMNPTPVETTLLVEVDVSDRGFLGSPDELVEGANSLRVTWAFETRPATGE